MAHHLRWPFGDLPRHHFPVIVADPGTKFATWSAKGITTRSPETKYRTMSLGAIQALPVGELAARDARLFLWVTTALAAIGAHVEIMKAWGFEPSALAFCWVKTTKRADLTRLSVHQSFCMNGGYTTRKNVELCFLGRRGSPPERLRKDVRELIIAPRREHSRKPIEALERIERLVAGPYLELFSRQTRRGWSVWGDQVGLFDSPGAGRGEEARACERRAA